MNLTEKAIEAQEKYIESLGKFLESVDAYKEAQKNYLCILVVIICMSLALAAVGIWMTVQSLQLAHEYRQETARIEAKYSIR